MLNSERKRIISACHSDLTSGNFGVKRTISRIRERFSWKGLHKDVERYVSFYSTCLFLK